MTVPSDTQQKKCPSVMWDAFIDITVVNRLVAGSRLAFVLGVAQ